MGLILARPDARHIGTLTVAGFTAMPGEGGVVATLVNPIFRQTFPREGERRDPSDETFPRNNNTYMRANEVITYLWSCPTLRPNK